MSPQETPPTTLPEQRIHSMTTPVEIVSANGGTLLRFAAVLCTTFALHIAMTPPNPPPSVKELLDVSQLERMSMRVLTPSFRYIFILPGFIEIIAIAMQFLTLPEYDLTSGTCAQHISFNPVMLIACVLGVLGMGIRLWCYRALGRLFTFQLALLSKHKLVTTGPYAFVWHPAYTGAILALSSATLANTTRDSWAYECGVVNTGWGTVWALWVVVSSAIMVERCAREDRILRIAFGEEWEEWSQKVNYRLVPRLF
ncbi:hypothetical protein HYDPIDRAFT_120608 [Hydnomerulius pinastri MD-312]|uniref:Protein-S-isoprenylcysteine O-methyltransferase n=1 Tax=Hydnomerulius pinastri MD-312 TaxID=994086 RepID=A0A0C2PQY2_9AGAM|nr:hypothetical protein HYDPIDRAFT_120608 [Hydnomerulius pinastri MD-312]